jgi:hypothetical protein
LISKSLAELAVFSCLDPKIWSVPYQVKNILYIYPFWVLTTHPYLYLNLSLAFRGCRCGTILLNRYGHNLAGFAIGAPLFRIERKFKTQNPNLSQSLTTDEFDAFWKEADSNGDGKLDYEEFIKMMRQY